MALAETLNNPMSDPIGALGGVMREQSIQKRGAKARELIEPTMRAESEARTALEQETARARTAQIDEEKRLQEGFVTNVEAAQTAYQSQLGQQPERTITAFNPERATELAVLTAIMGAFAGGISGRAGLAAMKGVSEGYRSGQEDLYKREVDNYEAALGQYKQTISEAKQIYDNAVKLESEKRGAGLIELKKLDPLLQDSVITAKVRAQDLKGVGDSLREAMKLADQMDEKVNQAGMRATAAQQKAREDKQRAMLGIEPPPYTPIITLHASGIPLAPMNPYAGVEAQKNFDAILSANLKDAQSTFDRIRKEDDKNATKEASMNMAEAALRRMVLKAFELGKKEGKYPKDAVFDPSTMTVKGGNLPQVTGNVYGLPLIGEFFQQIRNSKDPDSSTFTTQAREYQRGSYVPGEGQISNYERELFKQASIDLGRPIETNLELIRATRAAAKRQRDRKQFYEEYFAVNRTLQGAEQFWRLYSEANQFAEIDQFGNYRYKQNVPDYRTWFRSQQGRNISEIQPQQQFTAQPTQQSGGGLSPQEEARYQELLRKQRGGQ